MPAVYEAPVQPSLKQTLLESHPMAQTRVDEIEVHPPAVNQTNLQIELLLESVESPAIREAVQPVFRDLLRLLDCLHLFEGFFLQTDQAHETLAMFELVQVEARSLVSNIRIRSLTMQTSGIGASLMETLDGIAFAIGQDLHRVFDFQLSGLTYESPAGLVIGELIHSHGLLTNCVQESIITLAQQFDPTTTGARLFQDANAGLTESLLLCRDLSELIQFVKGLAESPGELSATSIVERVVQFRRGSMRFLMYPHWKEYEMFSTRITLASADRNALGPVLDAFGCYLETLLRLVSSRSVLSYAASQSLSSEPECTPLEQ
jgi:hypothetical protein